jgi:hypothetical protein
MRLGKPVQNDVSSDAGKNVQLHFPAYGFSYSYKTGCMLLRKYQHTKACK